MFSASKIWCGEWALQVDTIGKEDCMTPTQRDPDDTSFDIDRMVSEGGPSASPQTTTPAPQPQTDGQSDTQPASKDTDK